MESRMDEFKVFVSKYPLIKEDVRNGNKTWQQLYEDFVILGEDDESFKKYKPTDKRTSIKLEDLLSSDNLKNIWGYIKKINPDTISKTLNTIQKVLQITQSFGGKTATGLYNANYNSWWD